MQLDIPKYWGASMLPFEYHEHFSGSENLLQVSGRGSGTLYIKERCPLVAVSA
jgi:hypothetical protein